MEMRIIIWQDAKGKTKEIEINEVFKTGVKMTTRFTSGKEAWDYIASSLKVMRTEPKITIKPATIIRAKPK